MSYRAWVYIWSVLIAGGILTALAVLAYTTTGAVSPDPLLFGTLVVFASIAQLFEAEHGRQSYYPHFVFFLAGVFLLNPFLFFVLLVTIPHLVEWVKERIVNSTHLRHWYIQPFNISVHIIAGATAYWVYITLNMHMYSLFTLSPVMAATIAVLAYVGINHALVGLALMLARGISLKQSGVLSADSILPDLVMAFLGYILSVLWLVNPWLILPAMSPLVLMYQALMIPRLKQEAQTDSKTGLWNARHFSTLFSAELERARRFNRPLALIMADLDLLRNINNTYGHLAGDAVLAGIGQIIRDTTREYDIASRFGGEEFAIVLPEAGQLEALSLAERLRCSVETTEFKAHNGTMIIHATMSIGVACFPSDALIANELIHQADVAVYQAKLNGRNCVVCASEVPPAVKEGIAISGDRLSSPHDIEFVPRPMPDPTEEDLQPDLPRHATAGAEPASAPVLMPASAHTHVPHTTEVLVDIDNSVDPAHGEQEPETPPNELILISTSTQAQVPSPQVYGATLTARAESPIGRGTLLWLFLGLIIAAGGALGALGFVLQPQFDVQVVGLLVVVAVVTELFKINLYGDNTISLSIAVVFAAALVAGIPGVACVSGAIALVHYVQMRPALYKVPFNWAAHLMAGAAPALAMSLTHIPLHVANLPLLAVPAGLAAFAYYLIDTGLIAVAIGLSKGTPAITVWKDYFRWLAGHYMVLCGLGLFLTIAYTSMGVSGVVVFSLPVLMMRYAQKQYVERTQVSMRELQRMNRELAEVHQEVLTMDRAMQQLNEELFLTLSKIIDARDPYMGGHAAKVAEYATAIGAELGLSPERLEKLRQAGFLHDIGKIAISEQVLQKKTPLSVAEYEYIKTHAAIGGEFLEMCGSLRHLAPFVRHHHERWDGKGYPQGLKGEEIPLEARILAVCDAAEAMVSDRPYRRGMSIDELMSEVKRCSGTQFDPAVVEAFVKVVEREKEQLVVNSAVEVEHRQGAVRTVRRTSYNSNGRGNGRATNKTGRIGRTLQLASGRLFTGQLKTGQLAAEPEPQVAGALTTTHLSLYPPGIENEGYTTLAGTGPLTGSLTAGGTGINLG